MKSVGPLSIAEQMKVLQSREDVATWSLAHLGLPQEWRNTNEDGNTHDPRRIRNLNEVPSTERPSGSASPVTGPRCGPGT